MAYKKIKKDGTPAKPPGRKPNPNKVHSPGYGKGRKGPRPHTWKIGADAGEYKHSMYLPWLKSKAQANFRNEGWTLTFEQYYNLWKDCWHQRGRASDELCMSRIDSKGAWSAENTIIITRQEHLSAQGSSKKNKTKQQKYAKLKVQK